MFRSLDHPQGATLFLAKVTSKNIHKIYLISIIYITDMLLQYPVNIKEFY